MIFVSCKSYSHFYSIISVLVKKRTARIFLNLTAKSSKLHAKFKSNRICSSTPAGSRVMVPCNVQQFSNCAILLLSFKLSDQNKSFYRRHKSKQTNKSFSNKTLLKFRKSQNDFFKRTFPPKTKQ